MRSASEKSRRSERVARSLRGGFFSVSETRGISAWNGVRSGVDVKAVYMGTAAASKWVIGFRPRISSMVRSMDTVL